MSSVCSRLHEYQFSLVQRKLLEQEMKKASVVLVADEEAKRKEVMAEQASDLLTLEQLLVIGQVQSEGGVKGGRAWAPATIQGLPRGSGWGRIASSTSLAAAWSTTCHCSNVLTILRAPQAPQHWTQGLQTTAAFVENTCGGARYTRKTPPNQFLVLTGGTGAPAQRSHWSICADKQGNHC